MKRSRVVRGVLVLALVMFPAAFAGCGGKDDNKGTNPTVPEPFESGTLTASGSFLHVFTTVGSFDYRCRFHNGMTGTVGVAAVGSDSVVVPINDNVFGAPTTGTFPVKTGGYVRWVKSASGTAHTVTRP